MPPINSFTSPFLRRLLWNIPPQDHGYQNKQTLFRIRHDDKDDDGDKISTRVTGLFKDE